MRRRRPSPSSPAPPLDETAQAALLADLAATARRAAALNGVIVAVLLTAATLFLYGAPRGARRWEFGRAAADGADGVSILSLALSAVAAVRPRPRTPVLLAAAALASVTQAALLVFTTPPAPRVGWRVAAPLWAAAAAPGSGVGVVLAVRAAARSAEVGIEALSGVRYRYRDV